MTASEKDRRGADTASRLTDNDFAQDKMGRNSLQGEDQQRVRNERHDQPDTKPDADDVLESFEKMDKETRARKDLGKGARHPNDGDQHKK